MNLSDIERSRYLMIQQQVRPWQVEDPAVLEALASVRREAFVPAAYKSLAFAEFAIPLPAGQCMLTPVLEGRLLQQAAVQPGERVLLIGAGSGHLAALLAWRAQRVVALEIEPELVNLARSQLRAAGVNNVDVRQMDGALGSPAEGPFDVIVLAGSVYEVPQALLDQLKPGPGRLVALVGEEPIMHAQHITRSSATQWNSVEVWDACAPTLRGGFAQPAFCL